MKNLTLLLAAVILSANVPGKGNASATSEDLTEQKKTVNTNLPLNLETEEIMKDMLALNQVYKKVEGSKQIAPNSDVLKVIEETTTNYISDLKQIYPKVSTIEDTTERQKLVDDVHQKNNPFASFYY